jgi:hypothetical protein
MNKPCGLDIQHRPHTNEKELRRMYEVEEEEVGVAPCENPQPFQIKA